MFRCVKEGSKVQLWSTCWPSRASRALQGSKGKKKRNNYSLFKSTYLSFDAAASNFDKIYTRKGNSQM